jgi:hypothetical protein
VKPVSWLTSEQAAEHLGLSNVAFRKWLQRERDDAKRSGRPCRVKVYWLRGRMRFARTNLDACVEIEGPQQADLTIVRGRRA